MNKMYSYTIEDVEPEELELKFADFVVIVWDRYTEEEFESEVTEEWLEKYGVDTSNYEEVMEFVEMYWAERGCEVIN